MKMRAGYRDCQNRQAVLGAQMSPIGTEFMDPENNESLLDAKEVRRLLRCSLPLVYKMAERGQIPCIRWECPGEGLKKARTMLRFKRSDIWAFIEKHYKEST